MADKVAASVEIRSYVTNILYTGTEGSAVPRPQVGAPNLIVNIICLHTILRPIIEIKRKVK
jgi:hypothetical protein